MKKAFYRVVFAAFCIAAIAVWMQKEEDEEIEEEVADE